MIQHAYAEKSITPLNKCLCCKVNGEPFLINDLTRGCYYIYCEQCDDDISFCSTMAEAMLIYKKKSEQLAQGTDG